MGEQRIEHKAVRGDEVVDVIEWRGDRGTARGDELKDPHFYSRWTTARGKKLHVVRGDAPGVWLIDDENAFYLLQAR